MLCYCGCSESPCAVGRNWFSMEIAFICYASHGIASQRFTGRHPALQHTDNKYSVSQRLTSVGLFYRRKKARYRERAPVSSQNNAKEI